MRALLSVGDGLGWAVALYLASLLRYELVPAAIDVALLARIALVAVVAQAAAGMLLQWWRGAYRVGTTDDSVNLLLATSCAAAAVFVVNLLAEPGPAPRSVPLIAAPIALGLAQGMRLVLAMARERHSCRRAAPRAIVLADRPDGEFLVRVMLADPTSGYRPVALLGEGFGQRPTRIAGVPVEEPPEDLTAAVSRFGGELLVVAGSSRLRGSLERTRVAATAAGIGVTVLPSVNELLHTLGSHRVRRDPLTDPAATREWVPAARSRAKRAMDLTLGLLGLVLALPVLLVIAAVLAVCDRQVVYRAPRIGRGGRPFTMYKFATMRPAAGPRVTRAGDPRITRIGGPLRRSKLNELPQVFNVIRGDMSLVGPRPEDPRYAAAYSAEQRQVLAVRPGMTSLAFLHFGDEQELIERARPPDVEAWYLQELLPEKIEIELRYIATWSVAGDLRILARTVVGLLS